MVKTRNVVGSIDQVKVILFGVEEVSSTVSIAKCGKAAGPDGLMIKYLKTESHLLLNVLNTFNY